MKRKRDLPLPCDFDTFLLERAVEGMLLDDKQTKYTKIYTVAGKSIGTSFYVLRHVLINRLRIFMRL